MEPSQIDQNLQDYRLIFRILKVGDDPGIRDINKFLRMYKKKLKNNKKNYVHAMLYSKILLHTFPM